MTDALAALGQAQAAYEARRWDEAMAQYQAAREAAPLALDDAERFAWCHVWTLAPVAEGIGAFEDLESQAREQGERVVAADAAIEQVRMHAMVESEVLVGACYSRALESAGDDKATLLRLEMYGAIGATGAGDFARARRICEGILPKAQALGDRTVEALAVWQIGAGLVVAGEVEEGTDMLDRSMALATGGEMHPLYAGMLTCGVVMTCRGIGDWQRAKEWTEVADRICSRNAVCHYPGHCSVFRSEFRRLDGDLVGAAEEATDSLLLNGDWSKAWTGAAYHQRGEAELCRGNLADAQVAFAQAIELGYNPQPGQAQLHVLAGDPEAAFRSISRALDDTAQLADPDRLLTLAVGVAIAVDTGELGAARRWVDRLGEFRVLYKTEAASAAAREGAGCLALADGETEVAVAEFRGSVADWAAAGSVLHSARARVLLAAALDRLHMGPDAALERSIAANIFERLGAVTDLDAIADTGAKSGPVRRTLSFTDIVGSSQLLAAMGDEAWAHVLGTHDDILRSSLAEFAGTEVKHEGDGLFVSFESEDQAVGWAIEVQRRLHTHRTGTGFLPQVRIGVHCGDALRYGDDFIGRCVHETARIANAAGAGQIFVSNTTMLTIGDPPPVTARHSLELKGFDDRCAVVEVGWKDRP